MKIWCNVFVPDCTWYSAYIYGRKAWFTQHTCLEQEEWNIWNLPSCSHLFYLRRHVPRGSADRGVDLVYPRGEAKVGDEDLAVGFVVVEQKVLKLQISVDYPLQRPVNQYFDCPCLYARWLDKNWVEHSYGFYSYLFMYVVHCTEELDDDVECLVLFKCALRHKTVKNLWTRKL